MWWIGKYDLPERDYEVRPIALQRYKAAQRRRFRWTLVVWIGLLTELDLTRQLFNELR